MWISIRVHCALWNTLGAHPPFITWQILGNTWQYFYPSDENLPRSLQTLWGWQTPCPTCGITATPAALLQHHVQWYHSEQEAGNTLTQRKGLGQEKAEKYSRFSTLYLLASQSLWALYQWQKITPKSNPIKSKHKHAFWPSEPRGKTWGGL